MDAVMLQLQRGAGLAAAVALLRPVSSQPASPETRSALSGDAPPAAAGVRLPAAAAELSEVSHAHSALPANALTTTCSVMKVKQSKLHSS